MDMSAAGDVDPVVATTCKKEFKAQEEPTPTNKSATPRHLPDVLNVIYSLIPDTEARKVEIGKGLYVMFDQFHVHAPEIRYLIWFRLCAWIEYNHKSMDAATREKLTTTTIQGEMKGTNGTITTPSAAGGDWMELIRNITAGRVDHLLYLSDAKDLGTIEEIRVDGEECRQVRNDICMLQTSMFGRGQ